MFFQTPFAPHRIPANVFASRLQHRRLSTKWLNMTTNNDVNVNLCLLGCFQFQLHCMLVRSRCNRTFCSFRLIRFDGFCVYSFHQLLNITLTFLRAKPTKTRQKLFEDFLNDVGCADFFHANRYMMQIGHWRKNTCHYQLPTVTRTFPWSRSKKCSAQREPFLNIN